jgi:acyl carrier protein
MDRSALRLTLIDLLENETGTRYEDLNDETVLTEGLGLDSIDLVSLIVQVENRFHIKIATEELRSITKVGQMLDLLQKKTAAPEKTEAAGAGVA